MRPLFFAREVARMALADLTARPLRAFLSLSSFASSIAIAVVLIAAGGGLRSRPWNDSKACSASS